jgi:hypothetical protein
MVTAAHPNGAQTYVAPKLPPVMQVAVATLTLIVIGGIFTAAFLPNTPPLALPIVLTAVAAFLLIANIVMVSRIQPFAWKTFFLVGRWALLAFIVIGGMLQFVFILDNTPPGVLAVLSGMLLIYVINIPLLFAFSVARYQPPD